MATAATTMARSQTGWRLSPAMRKATLVVHIVCGAGWTGADVVLGILLYRGWTTDDGAVAVSEFVPIAVPPLSVGVLLTGLLLGWGSKWGVLRYWWVFVKLILATIMV